MLVAVLLACNDLPPAVPVSSETGARLPRTWGVDCGGTGDFLSIQDAIAASRSGDTIQVAPCTYFGALDLLGKTLRVESTGGAAATIVNAAPGTAALKVANGEGPGTTVSGFTFQGGGGIEDGVVD